MESVGKTPARLRPSCRFVDDDDLPVLGDEVLDVLLEQGVRPHQLVDVVHRLGLVGVLAERRFFLLAALLVVEFGVLANRVDVLAEVGEDEQGLLVR